MHKKFATTSNVKAFYAAYSRLMERGAEEASWMLATGLPGFGKTRTVQHFATNNKGVYVRAKAKWTPAWMLRELCGELGLDASGSVETLFGRLIGRVIDTPIVVDEARHMLPDGRLLETLRDLSDVSGTTVILSGEEFVLARLASRHPQTRSRISEVVKFNKATLADVRTICNTLCEVGIADDLLPEILDQSGGFYREIKNAIATIERRGLREKIATVTLKDMAGLRLCEDRTSAKGKGATDE